MRNGRQHLVSSLVTIFSTDTAGKVSRGRTGGRTCAVVEPGLLCHLLPLTCIRILFKRIVWYATVAFPSNYFVSNGLSSVQLDPVTTREGGTKLLIYWFHWWWCCRGTCRRVMAWQHLRTNAGNQQPDHHPFSFSVTILLSFHCWTNIVVLYLLLA